MEKLLVEKDNWRILIDEEKNCLTWRPVGQLPSHCYIESLTTLLSQIVRLRESTSKIRVLADGRALKSILRSDVRWTREWLFAKLQANGVSVFAIVFSEHVHGFSFTNDFPTRMPGVLKIKSFNTLSEAQEWLGHAATVRPVL